MQKIYHTNLSYLERKSYKSNNGTCPWPLKNGAWTWNALGPFRRSHTSRRTLRKILKKMKVSRSIKKRPMTFRIVINTCRWNVRNAEKGVVLGFFPLLVNGSLVIILEINFTFMLFLLFLFLILFLLLWFASVQNRIIIRRTFGSSIILVLLGFSGTAWPGIEWRNFLHFSYLWYFWVKDNWNICEHLWQKNGPIAIQRITSMGRCIKKW